MSHAFVRNTLYCCTPARDACTVMCLIHTCDPPGTDTDLDEHTCTLLYHGPAITSHLKTRYLALNQTCFYRVMRTRLQLEHNVPVEHNQYAANQSRPYGGRDNSGMISGYGSGRAAPPQASPYLAVYDRPSQGDTRFSQNRDVSAVERVYGRSAPPMQMGMTHTNTNTRDSGEISHMFDSSLLLPVT